MSFKQVNQLRKSGKLEEALQMAKQDLEEEHSEWTYSALFWVLRDYCNLYISQEKTEDALDMLQQMEAIIKEMDDKDGFAQRATLSLKRQLTPFWEEVNKLSEQSKNDQEEQAYHDICDLHREHPLSENLHEKFGWIIYRYLKNHYQSCGSLESRKALHLYLQLKNKRPSTLHSNILNVATFISQEYEDFKFLPFLDLWDVHTLASEDFLPSTWNDKSYPPLVERIIERCFHLGYSLKETSAAFTKNERVTDELIRSLYSKAHFFKINSLKSGNDDDFFSAVENYVSSINGMLISNEYHSIILSLYLWKLPDERTTDAIPILDKWGLDNFRNEDWQREKVEDNVFPSLAEKAVKHYFSGLKANKFSHINEKFETLLREACRKIDDDLLDRSLAQLLIAKGNQEEALSIYRTLLLSLNRYYVWKELAEVTDDKELKMSAYCKAIVLEPKDEYLGDVHLGLAELMIDHHLYKEAKRELQTFSNTYHKMGWRLKDEYYSHMAQIPKDITACDSNATFYKSHLESAEAFVYSEIEWTPMFVIDVFTPRGQNVKIAKLSSADGMETTINSKKLGVNNNNLIGKCFDVKIHKNSDKNEIALIRPSSIQLAELIPPVTGVVDGVNDIKKLFHCVWGHHKDMIIPYSQTKLRPKIGDYVSIYFIERSNREGNKYLKLLDIKAAHDCEKKLTKTVTGKIRKKYNIKGKPFGFVDDYYVSGKLLSEIEDGDCVILQVVYDGEQWKTYSAEKTEQED